VTADRAGQLRAGLAAVRSRIETACASSGRDPETITLVVVTKTFPASDVRLLAGLGVRDIGENRDAEGAAKAAETSDLDIRRHFIGRLQTNKARSVARWADLVHSVDRPGLVAALARAATAAGRRLDCLVQVSLDGDVARGGALIDDVPGLADALAAEASLRLLGVMAMAPLGVDPLVAFDPLPGLSERVRAAHPDAVVVSAGMSADLEAAIARGTTHLRVGSAVLGERPPLQ
jgi:pyridoxal phosphate enzyme (YggS family)